MRGIGQEPRGRRGGEAKGQVGGAGEEERERSGGMTQESKEQGGAGRGGEEERALGMAWSGEKGE